MDPALHSLSRQTASGGLERAEIDRFLSHLAVDGDVSASTQNQALNALVFLYKHVLRIDLGDFSQFTRAKRPRKLPVVLTREEVARLLDALDSPFWLMATLLYGSGLRLMDCLRLRVKDIDFLAINRSSYATAREIKTA